MPGTKTKNGSTKKKKKKKKARAITLRIDPALSKEWKKHLAVLTDAKRRGMCAFDEQWEAIAAIAENAPPLYLAAGCATFRAFLVSYLEAKTGKALRGRIPVAFDRLKVPVDEDGARKNVALASATAAQILAATRLLDRAPRAKESSIVKALERRSATTKRCAG